MLCIMVTGTPLNAMNDTTKLLTDYFTSNGVSCECFRGSYGNDLLSLGVYKWLNERSSEVVILSGPLMNVPERAKVLTMINDYLEKHPGLTVNMCAVNLEYSVKYIMEHSNKNGNKKINENALRSKMFGYQQPIKDEGFEMVYHLFSGQQLDIDRFIPRLNKAFDYDYPYNSTEESSAEASVESGDSDGE